jgi:hypothetical protein
MGYKNPEAQREYQRQWVARKRAAFFTDKTCEWCPATEGLELHHRDPSKKEHHAIWSWSTARRLAELAKCIVLCEACHQKAHADARRVEAELRNPHGTVRRYWNGCRCEPCREAHRVYNREHPARRAA